jgi:hypothetical protein
MTGFISKRLKCLKNFLPNRLQGVGIGYVLSLMRPAQRHSLQNAADQTGLSVSQFSRFLFSSLKLSEEVLGELFILAIAESLRAMAIDGVREQFRNQPWIAHLIIDSTKQCRSSSGAENIQKYTHGGDYWLGHRPTNIALLINGEIIPMAPLWHYTREYCRENKLIYQTEPELVYNFLEDFDISKYSRSLKNSDLCVLMDAGYDVKTIESLLCKRGIDFIVGMKSTRNVLVNRKNQSPDDKKTLYAVAKAFASFRVRAKPKSCHILSAGQNAKRVKVTVQRLEGFLKGVKDCPMAILRSQIGHGKVKYLACSRFELSTAVLTQCYAFRFSIEVFHKDTKQYLGFDEMGVYYFNSVLSHTHWVYVAYLMLRRLYPDETGGTREIQKRLEEELRREDWLKVQQLATRFGSLEQIQAFTREKLVGNPKNH